MNKTRKWSLKKWVVVVGLSILGVCGIFYAWGLYALRTWKLPPLIMSAEDKARVEALQKSVDAVVEALRKGEVGWRRADHSTVGFPEKESQLVKARNEIEIYYRTFHRLPQRLSDLLKIRTATLRQKFTFAKIAWECEFFPLTSESYILNCDGWKAPQKAKLEEMVGGFDRETERFYVVEGHVVLYVPPFVRGRAPTIGEPGPRVQNPPR